MPEAIVNLRRLEDDIVKYAQPQHRQRPLPLPDYVEHQEGVDQIGKLSAQAVVHQYEMAAQAVEAMGAEMKNVVARCEEIIQSAHAAMKEAAQAAAGYRDDAKKIFNDLEAYALLTQDVTKTCQEMRQKVLDKVSPG